MATKRGDPMRGLAAVGALAMLLGMGAIGGSVPVVEPGEAALVAPDAGAVRDEARGFTEVASVIYAEPALGITGLSIEAIVFVKTGKYLKDVRCPLFTVERDAPKTKITAFCEARKDAIGKQASLDVRADNPNANSASGCGVVRELRRDTRFSCTVRDPHMVPEASP
jgi:hypothetical protein